MDLKLLLFTNIGPNGLQFQIFNYYEAKTGKQYVLAEAPTMDIWNIGEAESSIVLVDF
ncbi:hypothetical protein D9M70_577740 [compost metagenome]